MKKLFVITALLGVTFAATAQNDSKKPFRVSIGAEAGLPMGDYGDYYSAVFGGSLQGEYSLDDNLAATLNAGYLNFSGKNGSGSDGFEYNVIKSSFFISIARENRINAKHIFNTIKPSPLAFI